MISPGSETIAAVATGPGGGIGIVRISGPDALSVGARVFRARDGSPLAAAPPFLLVRGLVRDPDSGEDLDDVLAVRMPEGRSYTGEPTVEIHGHGGRGVLEDVLQAALRAGARVAAPGEFTKRAFLSGRLDLSQAEAVAELIAAESESARRGALQRLQGAVSGEVDRLRERLLDLVARVEAALDFEDEEVPAEIPTAAHIALLGADVRELAMRACAPNSGAGGARVAFAGRANSGKSSIFNYLLDYERSIVAPVPGTTRDYIEERSAIGGATITLIDTAGMRSTDDFVESEGVKRSLRQIEDANVVVLVLDGSVPSHPDDRLLFELTSGRPPLVVISKADLPLGVDPAHLRSWSADASTYTLSTVTGEGFPEFTAALAARCHAITQAAITPGATPGIRHREALERVAGHLAAAAQSSDGRGLLDQVALELQAALAVLGEITGETASEEILERIFSRFCVGK